QLAFERDESLAIEGQPTQAVGERNRDDTLIVSDDLTACGSGNLNVDTIDRITAYIAHDHARRRCPRAANGRRRLCGQVNGDKDQKDRCSANGDGYRGLHANPLAAKAATLRPSRVLMRSDLNC